MTTKKIVVGFDGFVDVLVKPVKEKSETTTYFDTIGNFGRYLTGQEGKSCSIEVDVMQRKHGGNAPLLSTAACHLGMDVTCIGMMGYPELDPVFAPLPFEKVSYMSPGESTALEFNDGKIFIAPGIVSNDPWGKISQAMNNNTEAVFREADAIALVNWSEITFAKHLWENVLNCLPDTSAKDIKHIIFDLCDTTRKPASEAEDILRLIGAFSKKGCTTLSLNENECLDIGKKIFAFDDCKQIANKLRKIYGIDEVVVHATKWSFLSANDVEIYQDTIFIENPAVSTGAGDNYNAAYTFAVSQGMHHEERITFCHKFVHGYISKGGY